MFYLKELPTQAMIDKYAANLSESDKHAIDTSLHLMRKASVLVRKIEQYFVKHQLSQLRFLILIVVDREPDRTSLSPHEIAQKLDVSRPVLTRTIKKLQEDDFITSHADQSDKRAKQISLTRHGKQKLMDILPAYFDIIGRHD